MERRGIFSGISSTNTIYPIYGYCLTSEGSYNFSLDEKFKKKSRTHTAASIRWSSPTQLLISRSEAYLWLIEREAEFSTVYGRM